MQEKVEKVARAGYVAKGSIYGIIGVLTFLAAFNMGGQSAGQLQVLEFLEKQSFGQALLILMGLGLLCYSCWRFFQAIKDPENIGSDKKGLAKRFGFFISGLIYLGLAVISFLKVIDAAGSSGSGQNGMMSDILTGAAGVYIFAVIGIGLIIASIFQFKKAITGEFLEKLGYGSISEEKRRKTIKNTGYLGLIARGIIFGIMSYFFIRAAVESNTSEIKNTRDAFSFLEESAFGSWLMGAVAAGFVCYAIYSFMLARYRKFGS